MGRMFECARGQTTAGTCCDEGMAHEDQQLETCPRLLWQRDFIRVPALQELACALEQPMLSLELDEL